jgi:hypothetical protein
MSDYRTIDLRSVRYEVKRRDGSVVTHERNIRKAYEMAERLNRGVTARENGPFKVVATVAAS